MSEEPKVATARIGTVAEEAARLIDEVATMARSSFSRHEDPGPYTGRPAQEPASAEAPQTARVTDDPAADGPAGGPSAGACSGCGGERDGTPISCRICPLCQGIALLRSVRPETVDRLADLASAAVECLREMAAQARASGPASTVRPASGSPSDSGRGTQDIPVNDEREE